MIASLVLTALFAFSAAFAVATLAACLPRYLAAFSALRAELRQCSDVRQYRHRVTRMEVRLMNVRVLRPDFNRIRRRAAAPSLLAAA